MKFPNPATPAIKIGLENQKTGVANNNRVNPVFSLENKEKALFLRELNFVLEKLQNLDKKSYDWNSYLNILSEISTLLLKSEYSLNSSLAISMLKTLKSDFSSDPDFYFYQTKQQIHLLKTLLASS